MHTLTLIFVSLLITTNAQADQCYLTAKKHPNTGNYTHRKVDNFRPDGIICRVPCKENVQGGDYKIEVVEKNAGGEIISKKPWSEEMSLEPDEQIKCSIDQAKRQARLDKRKQEEQTRQARQAKIRKLTEDFKRECIQEFSKKRGRSQEFNTCLAALFKKVFDKFDELPEDALKFNSSN